MSIAWENIAKPDLLLEYQAELGAACGFIAWYDQLTSEHDRLTKYLGNASVNECEALRNRYHELDAGHESNVPQGGGRSEEKARVCRSLIGALHSTATTARYLGLDHQTVIDVAFPNLTLTQVTLAEAVLEDCQSATRLAEECGFSRPTAYSVMATLGRRAVSSPTVCKESAIGYVA